jgi:outer membrane protein assembly factor BamB
LANGEVAWSNERFLHRSLSGPRALDRAVVFGDGEGYVHFLARDSGETLQRLPTDGSAVVGKPALSGTTLLVVTRNGGVFAFRPG